MKGTRSSKAWRIPLAFLALFQLCFIAAGQDKGLASINKKELKAHLEFLASDELEGRNTGEPGSAVAARYLAVQAEYLGLKPMNGDQMYFQPFVIHEKKYDRENSRIEITSPSGTSRVNSDEFYVSRIWDGMNDSLVIEGNVVFAGYGIFDKENHYNDFEGIDLEDKVVMIMTRGPLNREGNEVRFNNQQWNSFMNTRQKLSYLSDLHPKAVLIAMDPKSGREVEEVYPWLQRQRTRRSLSLDGENGVNRGGNSTQPRSVFISRSVADRLLSASGKTLEKLQMEIDRGPSPKSFEIADTRIRLAVRAGNRDMHVQNVFGVIEGSDNELKDEIVIYVAHYDHVGMDGSGGIFNGADDNGSGTVALLEIAQAFQEEPVRPKRSIGFLWVTGEEIGLFGSRYFAGHPLVPVEDISAVINMDMVGRSKTEADVHSARQGLTIVGKDSVKVIGGLQSKVLMEINKKTLKEMGLTADYTYNDINHPDRYFYRSDHVNFARKDIPVLFYSTGTHNDYHRVTDEEGLIDYDQYQKMTRLSYKAGLNVANYPGPIEVDNPMSSW